MELRPYQREAVLAARTAWGEGTKSVLWSMATGTGKTVTFSAEISRTLQNGERALVIAHRDELLEQAQATIVRCCPWARRMVHIVAAGKTEHRSPCVVGSVASLCRPRRLERYGPEHFGLVVVDEAHHAVAKSYRTILDRFPNARKLGVTATPDRADGLALGEVFDRIVFAYGLRDAIEDRYLVDIRQFAIRTGANLDGVGAHSGDLAVGALEDAVNTPERNRLVVESWLEHARHRPTIAFTCDVKHAHDLAQAYKDFGIRAEPVWGAMGSKNRKAALERLKTGRTQVSCNCALLTEGFDEPSVSCIQMARPTKSKSLYMQCIGRGTRLHPASGKTDLLVLDYVDASLRHTLVSAPTLLGLPAEDMEGKSSRETRDELRSKSEAIEPTEREAWNALPLEYRLVEVDPWRGTGRVSLAGYRAPNGQQWHTLGCSERQAKVLLGRGFDRGKVHLLTRGEASYLITEIARLEGWDDGEVAA